MNTRKKLGIKKSVRKLRKGFKKVKKGYIKAKPYIKKTKKYLKTIPKNVDSYWEENQRQVRKYLPRS